LSISAYSFAVSGSIGLEVLSLRDKFSTESLAGSLWASNVSGPSGEKLPYQSQLSRGAKIAAA
jgi:hypothetical protein